MLTFVKRALWSASPRVFNRLVAAHRGQTFSIGIRRGATPFALTDLPGNPVLTRHHVTDLPAAFVADPFMLRHGDGWSMFMEVFDRTCRLGRIGLAESADGCHWQYRRIVLREPFHLAYPFIFKHEGETYMVPDTPGQGVRLYRARGFPEDWQFAATLIDDGRLADATLLEQDGHWWLFAGRTGGRGKPMSLHLYHADSPFGPWHGHPANPVVRSDDTRARPGGKLLRFDGRLIRLAQVGVPCYGQRLKALAIDELTRTSYREREIEGGMILGPGRADWNAGGMHHMDAHREEDGWIACVDGWT